LSLYKISVEPQKNIGGADGFRRVLEEASFYIICTVILKTLAAWQHCISCHMIGSYTCTQQRPQRILMQTLQIHRCYRTFVTIGNITTLKAACNLYCSIPDLIRGIPCSLRRSCQCFEGIYCFHIQDRMA